MSGIFPTTPAPAEIRRQSLTPTLISVAHSLKRQVRSRGSQRWSFALKYSAMKRTNMAILEAFLMAQRGQYSTFTFVPPVFGSTSGTATGTVTVSGAHTAGDNTIVITGMTGTLKAGDFIKFAGHNKIYMLTADATTLATIEPPLLSALANGEAVTYNSVPFTCALASDTFESTLTPAGIFPGFEVSLVEVI